MLGKPEEYRPFTRTFIHGSWDGQIIFWEPMITRAHIVAKKDATDPAVRDALAERAHLVDMEGYAVAYVAQELGVPLRMVKHVSDNADEGAMEWVALVDRSARVLGEWAATHLG